jgi:DNA-binding IclR family transcriptional regulator
MAYGRAVPGSVQSIERAAAILHVVAGSGGTLGVTDIAEAVGLAKTTAHSLLRTLLLVGFVEQDAATGRYSLGSALRARASNWADALAARSGHAVRLATLAGDEVVVVHHVFRPDDSAQLLEVGTALPPSSALGKVLLAHSHPHTGSRTTPRPPAALAELAEVRARGWATGRLEHQPGTGGIAAPVRGAGGLVVAALGISGTQSALFDPHGVPRPLVLAMVTDAAHAVSRELGSPGA